MTPVMQPRATRFAAGSALLLVVLGLTVLAGWLSHTPALIQVLPQLPPVRRNAAACLVLAGLALLALANRRPRWLVVACTGIVGAVSLLTVVEYVFRVNAGIDEVLGPSDITVSVPNPARMPAVTAICLAVSSLGLLLALKAQSKRSALIVVFAGSITAAVGMATIMAYALGSSEAYGWGHITRAPLLTAAGFLVLGLGMLGLAWHVDPDPAGIPRWLPVSVAIGVATSTVGLWQALIAGGQAPFALLPFVVLLGGCLTAPILALTVYLAQRGHTQAAALRRNEAFLAKVQQVSATGGFYWWPETGKVYWSEEVYRIFEIDPEAPLTTELRQSRIHPDDLPAHKEVVARAVSEARDFEYQVRLLMPDHAVKYLHALAQATRDTAGKLLYVGAVQDMTQRRLSELALSKVRSELAHVARVTTLGAFTASIAHEVNQPLSGIITNASTCLRMLGADPANVEGARETARRAIRDGDRLAEIIGKLRALYSRKDTTPEPVDLNEAIGEVIALVLPDLQRNQVVLRTEFGGNLRSVTGDRTQLQQVVLNLIRNASDAMSAVDGRPRELLVRTEPDDEDGVRLSVRDTGVGLEPDAADRLFGAFYTTKHDGMGMGLSVSRSIIEHHHGRLWATRNTGPGATFSFSIPGDRRMPVSNRPD